MKIQDYIKSLGTKSDAKRKLANDLGVSVTTVRAWANGNRRPGRNQFLKIVSATGGAVTIDDLLGLVGD